MTYLRDPRAIYARSFEIVRREASLDAFGEAEAGIAERVIHACGMPDIGSELRFSEGFAAMGRAAISRRAAIICDSAMTAAGIMRRHLPLGNSVLTFIDHDETSALAVRLNTTRSAAAVDLWTPHLAGAVIAIGSAPTALFRLLERIEEGAPRPAVIAGFPVGFVGAAESKEQLIAGRHGIAFATLPGRRGGAAMAAAAINGLTDQAAGS